MALALPGDEQHPLYPVPSGRNRLYLSGMPGREGGRRPEYNHVRNAAAERAVGAAPAAPLHGTAGVAKL